MATLIPLIQFSACISAGTHGSIKSYSYPVRKSILEKAIEKVIASDPNVEREDTTIKNGIVDITNGKNDTIKPNHEYYSAYVDIDIYHNKDVYRYTFRYAGDENDWESDTTSRIFIAYAYKNDRGGSEGNGDIGWHTPFLKKKLIQVFEEEFIAKIDSELKVKHQ